MHKSIVYLCYFRQPVWCRILFSTTQATCQVYGGGFLNWLLWSSTLRWRSHELKTHYSHCSLPCCLGCCSLQNIQSSAALHCRTTGYLWEHKVPTCIAFVHEANFRENNHWMPTLDTHPCHPSSGCHKHRCCPLLLSSKTAPHSGALEH